MVAKILDFLAASMAILVALYLLAILWVDATLRRREERDETEEL